MTKAPAPAQPDAAALAPVAPFPKRPYTGIIAAGRTIKRKIESRSILLHNIKSAAG